MVVHAVVAVAVANAVTVAVANAVTVAVGGCVCVCCGYLCRLCGFGVWVDGCVEGGGRVAS